MAKKITSSMGGLSDARKGIKTLEGKEMANKKYQRDNKKADLDGDGKLTPYEKVRADAVQQSMSDDDPERDEKIRMYHGGMACGADEGMMSDPESGNSIPIGGGEEAEESADDSEPEEDDVIETPDGNEIEIAEVEMEEITLESEYPEEGDEGYYPSKDRSYSMMKTPKLQFII